MKIINTEKKVIKSWCNNPEEGAIAQAKNLANLPFLFKHVSLMPDTHQGYGMPIGGVIATEGVVIPNAVGVDIGCGMCAMQTSMTNISTENLKSIVGKIRELVPVGFKHHSEDQEWDGFQKAPLIRVVLDNAESARKQLGTLGGGNHFIEIQKGDDGFIWVMVHSGSRNFGYQIAKVYNAMAQELCKKWYSNIPEFKGEDGLAFLPLDSDEGKEYLNAMNYALDFAYANRKAMLHNIRTAFIDVVGDSSLSFMPEINIHHNFASMENHFGKNVMVHRKGATQARDGQLGIIPGSQGTASYIVEGLGNPESFESCSHGAGRKMGRKQAQRELSVEKEVASLNASGILHSIRCEKNLDEAPGAYKDIKTVMDEQSDLVKIKVELNPLAVIKG